MCPTTPLTPPSPPQDLKGRNPFHLAALEGKLEVIQYLFEHKASTGGIRAAEVVVVVVVMLMVISLVMTMVILSEALPPIACDEHQTAHHPLATSANNE